MKTVKSLIVTLSLLLFAQGAFAQDTKIGVLNALLALFNSDAAQVVQQELEQEFAQDEQRANELTEQLQAIQGEYQQNEAVMTEEEMLDDILGDEADLYLDGLNEDDVMDIEESAEDKPGVLSMDEVIEGDLEAESTGFDSVSIEEDIDKTNKDC